MADLPQRAAVPRRVSAVTAGSCGAPKQGKKKAARGSGRWNVNREYRAPEGFREKRSSNACTLSSSSR